MIYHGRIYHDNRYYHDITCTSEKQYNIHVYNFKSYQVKSLGPVESLWVKVDYIIIPLG